MGTFLERENVREKKKRGGSPGVKNLGMGEMRQ